MASNVPAVIHIKIFHLASNLTDRVASCRNLITFGGWWEGKAGINLTTSAMSMPSNGPTYTKSRWIDIPGWHPLWFSLMLTHCVRITGICPIKLSKALSGQFESPPWKWFPLPQKSLCLTNGCYYSSCKSISEMSSKASGPACLNFKTAVLFQGWFQKVSSSYWLPIPSPLIVCGDDSWLMENMIQYYLYNQS